MEDFWQISIQSATSECPSFWTSTSLVCPGSTAPGYLKHSPRVPLAPWADGPAPRHRPISRWRRNINSILLLRSLGGLSEEPHCDFSVLRWIRFTLTESLNEEVNERKKEGWGEWMSKTENERNVEKEGYSREERGQSCELEPPCGYFVKCSSRDKAPVNVRLFCKRKKNYQILLINMGINSYSIYRVWSLRRG